MMSKKLYVCSDDAGWDEKNDAVILQLAQQGRISATSLVTAGSNARSWQGYIKHVPQLAVGLHFNLTWQLNQPSAGLSQLILRSYLHLLETAKLKQQINQQLDEFEDIIGKPVDFIDGHQHVHMLPVIRHCLIEVINQRFTGRRKPAIRAPYSRCWRGSKAQLLNSLGAHALYTELSQHKILTNQDFIGVYDFSVVVDYAQRVTDWLAKAADFAMLMTHPGAVNLVEHAQARSLEAKFLASQQWLEIQQQYRVELVPFKPFINQ